MCIVDVYNHICQIISYLALKMDKKQQFPPTTPDSLLLDLQETINFGLISNESLPDKITENLNVNKEEQ